MLLKETNYLQKGPQQGPRQCSVSPAQRTNAAFLSRKGGWRNIPCSSTGFQSANRGDQE